MFINTPRLWIRQVIRAYLIISLCIHYIDTHTHTHTHIYIYMHNQIYMYICTHIYTYLTYIHEYTHRDGGGDV